MLCRQIDQNHNTRSSPRTDHLSTLTLAYLGDAIFEVFVRDRVAKEGAGSASQLHGKSTGYVNASAQAFMLRRLKDKLTDQEWSVVKRGRNQKSASIPKNATLQDYRYATGFETLLGWLYTESQWERLSCVMEAAAKELEKEKMKGAPGSDVI